VTVREVEAGKRIVLHWGEGTRVEMSFVPLDAVSTMVQIRESGWPSTDAGFTAAFGNCGGWMHMMTCLKAYAEYGINLREGGAR
jgi:uncharacterized protein YndB with AHSA1/START domain